MLSCLQYRPVGSLNPKYTFYEQRRTVYTRNKPVTAPLSSTQKSSPLDPQSPDSSTASSPPSRSPPKPAPSFPSPASLNAFAVSQLSARAHPSRPTPKISNGQLPEGYKNVARKFTYAIVALPIAIVTSWVLYQRCEYFFPGRIKVCFSDGEVLTCL